MYYLGIDGGGTKTRAVLINDHLDVIHDKVYDSTYILTAGEEKFRSIFENILEDTKFFTNNLEYVFAGLAGYGEYQSDMDLIESILHEVFIGTKLEVTNDSIAAWSGSLLCQNGVNVIAGTGSIIAGVKDKKYARIGGWGYLAGDEGSAYWIAIKAINIYSKMFDGRIEKTVLYDMINDEYELNEEKNFLHLIYKDMNMERSKIAKFSTICSKAAELGCEYSIAILNEGVEELILGIKQVIKELDFTGKTLVSYAGGVFNGQVFVNTFIEKCHELSSDIKVITPLCEPAYGAALYSYILAGNEVNDEVRNKYLSNSRK